MSVELVSYALDVIDVLIDPGDHVIDSASIVGHHYFFPVPIGSLLSSASAAGPRSAGR